MSRASDLLREAVAIIEEDREVLVSSFKDMDGCVRDPDGLRWLRKYDRFLKPARAYLKRPSASPSDRPS